MKRLLVRWLTIVAVLSICTGGAVASVYYGSFASQKLWQRAAEHEQQRINDTINPATEEYRKTSDDVWDGKKNW